MVICFLIKIQNSLNREMFNLQQLLYYNCFTSIMNSYRVEQFYAKVIDDFVAALTLEEEKIQTLPAQNTIQQIKKAMLTKIASFESYFICLTSNYNQIEKEMLGKIGDQHSLIPFFSKVSEPLEKDEKQIEEINDLDYFESQQQAVEEVTLRKDDAEASVQQSIENMNNLEDVSSQEIEKLETGKKNRADVKYHILGVYDNKDKKVNAKKNLTKLELTHGILKGQGLKRELIFKNITCLSSKRRH